jgi:hypothetical protein
VFGLDGWLRRRHGVYEYSAHPQCLFRIQCVRVDETIELADGTSLTPGSRALALHLWNEHVPAIRAGGPSIAWARRLDRTVHNSLRELMRYLATEPGLQDVHALYGDMCVRDARQAAQFARIAARYGFETRADKADRRGLPRRIGDGVLILMLVAATNPLVLRGAFFRHHNIRLYLSHAVLTKRYAQTPQAVQTPHDLQRPRGDAVPLTATVDGVPNTAQRAS